MLIEHEGKRPRVHESAYVAPTATVCGEVTIGEDSRVLFGAVVTAEGGPVTIGANCVIMENAVIRGVSRHPTHIGGNVLVGPHAHLTGCTVEDNVFIATGAAVFNGACIRTRATVRINGVVHIKTTLPEDGMVPVGWIAVGDPVEIIPPEEHEKFSTLLNSLNFAGTVFGLEGASDGASIMPELTRRYSKALGRHREDNIVD